VRLAECPAGASARMLESARVPETVSETSGPDGCCPLCGDPRDPSALLCEECLRRLTRQAVSESSPAVSVWNVLECSWQLYTQNLGLCLLASLLDLVLTIFGIALLLLGTLLLLPLLQGLPGLGEMGAVLIFGMAAGVYLSALGLGNLRFFLALARGEPVKRFPLFQLERGLWKMTGTGVCYWLLVLTGCSLLLVPGLMALVLLWPCGRLVADRNYGCVQAMEQAFRLTWPQRRPVAAIALLHLLILVLASGLPGLGHLLAVPFVAILYSVLYLQLEKGIAENAAFDRIYEELIKSGKK